MQELERNRGKSAEEADESSGRIAELKAAVEEYRQRETRHAAAGKLRQAVWRMGRPGDIARIVVGIRTTLEELAIAFHYCSINVRQAAGGKQPRFSAYTTTGEKRSVREKGHRVLEQIWQRGEVAYRRDLVCQDPFGEDHLRRLGVRAVVDVPGEWGTLAVSSRAPEAFASEDIALFQELAEVLSEGFRRIEDLRVLEQRNRELVGEVARRQRAEERLLQSKRRLQRQNDALVGLSHHWTLVGGQLDVALREVTETAARTLDVARVSVWVFDGQRSGINCLDLYEKNVGRHSCGEELKAADFPAYFAALGEERTIAAQDALTDPRTREFSDTYLTPLGIASLLDAPITLEGKMVGVICHEEVGKPRPWTPEEETFAGSMADTVALAMEAQQRRQAEEALREQEQRFRLLAENAQDLIFRYRLKPTPGFEYVSPAAFAITGYTPEEHYAEPLLGLKLVHPEDRPLLERWFADDKIPDGPNIMRWRTKGGREIWTETHYVPIHDETGRLLAVEGVTRDITGRQRMEQELIRLERLRALEEMAGGISHNLNNMLTGILLPAEILQMSGGNAQFSAELGQIVESARRARDLVQRLARSVASESRENPYPIGLAAVVEEAVQVVQSRWEEQAKPQSGDIEVINRLANLPPVKGTRSGLQDVIVNLLLNAMEAMPEGGTVTICAQVIDQDEKLKVQLRVADTGGGMDAETRRRVFEPFFTTKQTVDAGLGLSVAYGLVRAWGGDIEVESEEGKGSTFSVLLPIWEEKGHWMAKKGRILVVEDDRVVRQVLSRLLEKEYSVESQANGQEALEGFDPGQYDAVLLDLGLPGLPGDQAACQMRKLDPEVGCVLITGWLLEEDDPRLAVFDDRLDKPLDVERVLEVVARAVELREQRARARIKDPER